MPVLPSSQRGTGFSRHPAPAGFTLVELLVATAVLAVIVVLTVSLVNGLTNAVQQGSSQLQRMAQAQRAFELARRMLGEATLRPYFDYVDNAGNFRGPFLNYTSKFGATNIGTTANAFNPTAYARASELRFIAGPATPPPGAAAPPGFPKDTSLNLVSPFAGATPVTHAMFFQVPVGRTNTPADAPLRTLLNTVGFYVEYGKISDLSPTVRGAAPADKRFRLMMLTEPSESLSVYNLTQTRTYTGKEWYTVPLKQTADPADPTKKSYNVHLLAENVVAMVVRPKKYVPGPPAAWSYFLPYPYDSAYNNPAVGTTGWKQSETQHELPPVVELTLIALDATSAQRLEILSGNDSVTTLGLSALFANPSDATYASSMKTLTAYLTAHRLTYRLFTTDVSVEGAQW